MICLRTLQFRFFLKVVLLSGLLSCMLVLTIPRGQALAPAEQMPFQAVLFLEGLRALIMGGSLTWLLHRSIIKHIRRATKSLSEPAVASCLEQSFSSSVHKDNDIGRLYASVERQLRTLGEAHTLINQKNMELTKQKQIAVQSAKLASLGEMAGGIAHEINNPLQVIQGQADLILLSISDKHDYSTAQNRRERLEKSLQSMITSCERISKITRGLLHFARKSDGGSSLFALEPFVDELLSISQIRVKKYGIQFDIDWQSKPGYIYGNDVQIGQILINLINNAVDFLVDEQVRDPWIRLSIECGPQQVFFKLTNAGEKIANQLADKIFEPFFTTKNVDKGTGLGLSMSASIAKRHGGSLRLDLSAEYTTFVLCLPYDLERRHA